MRKLLLLAFLCMFIHLWAQDGELGDTMYIKAVCDFQPERFEKVKYAPINESDRFGAEFDSTIIYHSDGIYFTDDDIRGITGFFNKRYLPYYDARFLYHVPSFTYHIACPSGYVCWVNFYKRTGYYIKVLDRQLLFDGIRLPLTGKYHIIDEKTVIRLTEYPTSDTIITEEVQYATWDPYFLEYNGIMYGNAFYVNISPFYYDAKKRELYLTKMEVYLQFVKRDESTWDPSDPNMQAGWQKENSPRYRDRIYNYEDFLRWYPVSIDGVPSINNDRESKEGRIYDLLGREITHPVKGNIYIKNGRKILW